MFLILIFNLDTLSVTEDIEEFPLKVLPNTKCDMDYQEKNNRNSSLTDEQVNTNYYFLKLIYN